LVRQMPSQNWMHCEQVGCAGEVFEVSISGTPLGVREVGLKIGE